MNIKLKQNLSALTIFLCLGGLIGCSSTASKPANTVETKTVETNSKSNGSGEKTTTVKPDGVPSNTGGENKTTASSGDKIGVPECDTYIEKYEACISANVPESVRQSLKSSFEQTRQTWKGLAANPQTKSTLGAVCKQSQEMAKQAMSQYHCEW